MPAPTPNDGEIEVAGAQEANLLIAALGISASELIDKAYVDLLNERTAKQ